MVRIYAVIFSLCISLSVLQAEIIEIHSLEQVRPYVDRETLLFLNVGDTLFSPSCMLADNQWRQYFVKKATLLITDKIAREALINRVKGIVVEKIPKVTPEKITSTLIAEWQENKVPVLGYSQREYSTAYAPNNGEIVNSHLIGMGIELEETLTYYNVSEYGDTNYNFYSGILFTNKKPVGEAFKDFLLRADLSPSELVIVDDDVAVLEEVEACLLSIQMPCTTLRYDRVDPRKALFNPDAATLQFFAFLFEEKFLSDEEAIQMLSENPELNVDQMLDFWIYTQVHLCL